MQNGLGGGGGGGHEGYVVPLRIEPSTLLTRQVR